MNTNKRGRDYMMRVLLCLFIRVHSCQFVGRIRIED